MKKRSVAAVARKYKLGEEPKPADYWLSRTHEERWLEVEACRRLWIEITGDPDQPIAKVVQKRKMVQ
jgi:hypothetical protein